MSKYNAFYIGAHKIKLEYSSQLITPLENKTSDNSTNILSINISNVQYPITVDIIKQICSKFGKLQRIFIGKKNQENIVECLIEFDKISEAKAAKEALHGEDIYSGCCSLDVKYSKMSNVPVFKNDDESWDFTKSQIKPGILKSPPTNGAISSSIAPIGNIFQNNPVYPIYNYPPPLYTQISNHMQPQIHPFPPCRQPYDPTLLYNTFSMKKHSKKTKIKLEINKDAFVVEVGVVFMVYNLSFAMCVDHLFNLFCLYGNVHKIRFLPGQPGAAMVQMGSRGAVDLCMQHYNGRTVFGQEMRLVRCSKAEIFTSKNKLEFLLPNGTPCFKDFSGDPNNRFLNDHGIGSNKILEPNRTLHFFNAPYAFAETDLSSMILQSGVPRPLNIIIFNSSKTGSGAGAGGGGGATGGAGGGDQQAPPPLKKCIGLFEFHRLEDALVALAVLNHKPIIIPDANQVFHMKLTFSAREPKNSNSESAQLKRAATISAAGDRGDGARKKWRSEQHQYPQEDTDRRPQKAANGNGEVSDNDHNCSDAVAIGDYLQAAVTTPVESVASPLSPAQPIQTPESG